MLSPTTPQHLTPVPKTDIHPAPVCQNRNCFYWREAAAVRLSGEVFSRVTEERGGPPPQQQSFNQGQPDYRRLKCVEGVSLGLAYNSDRAR